MSWWNFGKKQEKRNNQANELGYGVCGGFSIFKNHNNAALSLSAVYSATELISNSIALLPIEIKYNDEAGKTQRNRQHPLNNTFNNNKLSKYMIVKMMVSDMLLYGNGFAYIQRNQQGEPIGLRYIESRDVNINWDKHKDRLFYTCGLFPNSVIKPEDMLHIYKNSYDGYNGIGILQYAKRAIDLANYTENSSLDYFAKGLNVTGILHAKQPMTKLQAE